MLEVCLALLAKSGASAGYSDHDVAPSHVRPVPCTLDGWLNYNIVIIIVCGRGKLKCSRIEVAELTFNL